MTQIIDLHIHTIFSDGLIDNIAYIADKCKIISITDHNSISAYFYFKVCKKVKTIVGCEVTVIGAPDYLVYFPKKIYLDEIEKKLEEIRNKEEEAIKYCYYQLGYNNWEGDRQKAFNVKQKIKTMRTRDLASILYMYRNKLNNSNGYFEDIDLINARKERRHYNEKFGNSISNNIAFSIANDYHGEIVLAHPIHTAIKKCSKGLFSYSEVYNVLLSLIHSFQVNGGKNIEWEYFSDIEIKRYLLDINEIALLQNYILEIAEYRNLQFTIGSDSHMFDNDSYSNYEKFFLESKFLLDGKFAEWIYL